MKEKTMLKIALICSLVGIIVLFFFSERMPLSSIDISKINEEDIGKNVKIVGKIEKVSGNEKLMFLEVGQEKIETISVVLFKDSDIGLKEGDNVEIIGSLEDYKGEKEVIANRIRII